MGHRLTNRHSGQEVRAPFELTASEMRDAKYTVIAALMETVQGQSAETITAIRNALNWIFDSEDEELSRIKVTISDGRLLDGADELMMMARDGVYYGQMPDSYCAKLFRAAGILYFPFILFKALDAYEAALKIEPDSRRTHLYLAQLYRRVKDDKLATKHQNKADDLPDDEEPEAPINPVTNVAIMPLTQDESGVELDFNPNLYVTKPK